MGFKCLNCAKTVIILLQEGNNPIHPLTARMMCKDEAAHFIVI